MQRFGVPQLGDSEGEGEGGEGVGEGVGEGEVAGRLHSGQRPMLANAVGGS